MTNLELMYIIKGNPKDDVKYCNWDTHKRCFTVAFSNSVKKYNYKYEDVLILKNPTIINPKDYRFTSKSGCKFFNIKDIYEFTDNENVYIRFVFNTGLVKSMLLSSLKVEKNSLVSTKTKLVFDYFRRVSEETGIKVDGKSTLTPKYINNSFISEETVLHKYLNCSTAITYREKSGPVLFPFGSNLSQIHAVRNALTNQISIIEGPPGTGKTQTILNIIANLTIRGNTVAVVSNNNDATKNVYEKMQKYGFDFLIAELGSIENKDLFIKEKQKPYPDFKTDILDENVFQLIVNDIFHLENELVEMFKHKNRISTLKQELSRFNVEQTYFMEHFNVLYKTINLDSYKMNSDICLKLWNKCQMLNEADKEIGLWMKIKLVIEFKRKSFLLFKNEPGILISNLKKAFYDLKICEMEEEINNLEDKLSNFNFDLKTKEHLEKSNLIFKHEVAKKYQSIDRKSFTADDLKENPKMFLNHYPIILSSTYSLINSLRNVEYDYVIVDEASQVDLATGVLAMACAKNIVIVGDLKQLPNVIEREVKQSVTKISEELHIPIHFRVEEQSLLSSICSVLSKAPRTLLREHYRCHPKIIGFCSKKFYNNELIVMTEDKGEEDVMKLYITSKGNHARGHYNQRQIDEIVKSIIPELNSTDLGIITPYRLQSNEINKQIDVEIPISTVHKFQGRENNDIIISTVDNEISEFTDNPNMLNVAISRAKNRLRVIISDNEKNENTNIGDLVKYIEYNNFEIKESEIYSVFDLLYKSFEPVRKKHLSRFKKVSEYDSENLMYSVIQQVLANPVYSNLKVISHKPLSEIIRDVNKLSTEEIAFVKNSHSHVDFLIYHDMNKFPLLAIEVDGYAFHNSKTKQHTRDLIKNTIFEKYGVPIIRFKTTDSQEKERLEIKLKELLGYN